MSTEDDKDAGGDDGKNVEEENTTEFEAVVHLVPVSVDSGEKDEDQIYKQRCALYRHVPATDKDPAQWKERGRGDIRLLQHKGNKMVRAVLREEKTLKLRCNHVVHPQIPLKPNEGSDRFWAWRTEDYSEEPATTETFGIKFKTAEVAQEFKKKWDESRKTNEAAISNKGKAGAATSAAAPAAAAAGAKDAKADPAVDALATAVGGVKIADAKAADQENLWGKIISERKFAPLTEDDIKKLWSSFDTNNDNKIDFTELKNLLAALLRAVLKQLQVPITEEVAKKMEAGLPDLVTKALTRLDTNKDGSISYDEFKAINEVKMVSS